MAICYIVGAGDFHGTLSPQEQDLVIAADAGINSLIKRGIRCDILLGDMDSLEESSPLGHTERLKSSPLTANTETITFPVKKDETDTHLAYIEGAKRGYTDFVIYGGVGGREDHTFANYSLLLYAKKRGHNVKLVGNDSEIFVLENETALIKGTPGATFSLFAFGGVCHSVSIKGATYNVSNITLTPDFPLGVSNSFEEETVTVSTDGALLVIKYI